MNQENAIANKLIYSIGYEHHTIDSFIKRLKREKIQILIDVRDAPQSRKNGFSKSSLDFTVTNNNIQYIHIKELGTPKQLRDKLRLTKNYKLFFEQYANYLLKHKEELNRLFELIASNRCCLMCLEHSFTVCHRKVILSMLAAKDPNLQIINLE